MTKATVYNLVIDKDRSRVLGIILQVFATNEIVGKEFIRRLHKTNTADVFIEMVREITDKEHALNWCEDPDCTYPKKS